MPYQMSAHFAPPQVYPSNMAPFVFDITKCRDPNVARCPSCNHTAMTRVEKIFSACQIISGVVLICSVFMIVPGVIILAMASDYEHFCTRCNSSIGINKNCCS